MTIQDNINKITAGTTAVNSHDVEGFIRLLVPDFKLYIIVKPEQLMAKGKASGPEGFATYLNMLYTAFSDIKFQQKDLTANGNMVYQQLLVLGKHSGSLILPNGTEVPPSGIKIRLPVEVFHTFNNHGDFTSSTGYVNLIDVMKQFMR